MKTFLAGLLYNDFAQKQEVINGHIATKSEVIFNKKSYSTFGIKEELK